MTTEQVTENKPVVETQETQVEQPIQVSRAKLDFPGDAPPEAVSKDTPLTETEQKLLQLNQQEAQDVEPSEEASEVKAEQPPTEEVTKDSTLPDLSELDIPEDLGVEPKEELANVAELPDTPEAKKFAEQFQEYLGLTIDEFKSAAQDYKQTIEYFNQVKAEQYYKQAKSTLSNEWGVSDTEVTQRLEKVQERFNKYPQELRDKLDNLEGAKLIWAKIEQESQAKAGKVPQFQKSRSVGNRTPKVMFTQKEIDAMPRDVYERNAEKIYRAYQLGLVQK